MKAMITGAGGSMGWDIAACLQHDETIGLDCDPESRLFAKQYCDSVLALPPAVSSHGRYVDALLKAISVMEPDALFITPDAELEAILTYSGLDCTLDLPWLVPSPEQLRICLDKWQTYDLCDGQVPCPATRLMNRAALMSASDMGPRWLRPRQGAGGRGAMLCRNAEEVQAWLTLHRDRDEWMVSEVLPGDNLNVTSLYWRGELVADAVAKRDGYVLASASMSGVTGEVSSIVTVDREDALEAAQNVLSLLPGELHGFYSIDFKEDKDGQPCLTEINARLAARPYLYAQAGVNFPALGMECLTGDVPETPGMHPGIRLLRKVGMPPGISEDESEAVDG